MLFIDLVIPNDGLPTSTIEQAQNQHKMITKHKLKQNPRLTDQITLTAQHASANLEPKTYKRALKIPCWLNAMKEENQASNENKTWTFVP